jgi:hypothetical protein
MKWLALVLGITLFAGSAVQAQIPTSSSEIRSNPAKDANIRGAIELERLVRCAVLRREKLARNLLKTRPGSDEQERHIGPFRKVMENCFNGDVPAMYLGNAEVRGTIANQLYLRAYPNAPDFAAFAHNLVPLPESWTASKLDNYERVQVLGHQFANCVVATDPASSDKLLRTGIRSSNERAAFRSLVPILGPCLPNGLKLELDVAWLRAVLAEAMMRSMAEWQPQAEPNAKGMT